MAFMLRLQAAMEYLMTYGWAILIIAVILGVLFQLGVFSSSSLLGTACIAFPGYQCTAPVLGTNGNLSFTFGQSTGVTLQDVGLACASTYTTNGLPNPAISMVEIDGNLGKATNQIASNYVTPNSAIYNALTLQPGQTIAISALKCFGTNANALASPALGTAFSGALYMNYTSSGSTVTGNWLTTKIATITIKVA